MPNAVVDTASAFTIREMTGERRLVKLVGRALPYRPYNLSGTQRTEITWLPGNVTATSQVLGGEEEPTDINGWWKDVFLGAAEYFTVNNRPITTAREADKLIDDIRRQGQQIEVIWDEHVRQGILKKFDRDWHNTHDLEWRISFEWTGRGENVGAPAYTQQLSVADTSDALERLNTTLQDAAVPVFPLSADFSENLLAALTALSDSAEQASDAVTALTNAAISPFDAARRTVAVTNAVVTQAKDLIELVQAQPARVLDDSTDDINTLTMGQIIAAEAFARGLVSAARALMRAAVIRRQVLAASVESELLATYVAREDEDLRDVAQTYYQTPFEWRRLMTFNELSSAALEAGQLVLVPRLLQGGV